MSFEDSTTSPRYMPVTATAAAAYVALFMLSQVLPKVLGQNANAPVVTPYSSDDVVTRFLAQTAHDIVPVGAFLQAASALALLMFAAFTANQIRHSRPESAHSDLIRASGIASGTLLLASASCQWVLSRPNTKSDLHTFRAVLDLVFITGAAPSVATTGLLIGTIAAAGRKMSFAPAWLNWLGLVVAFFSLVSMVSLLAEPMTLFIPLGRYVGMLWFLCLAASPAFRRGDTTKTGDHAAAGARH
ncbi:hypothetical protein [Nocardia nova]|uniref:hypothetical protein n=1 Tax=Nocardia nova TaxID=37330 RepID=UPI0011B09F3D